MVVASYSTPERLSVRSIADNVGLRLMAQACYDPRESVKCVAMIRHMFWSLTPRISIRMWARMSELEQKQGGSSWFNMGSTDFFQTHPANAKRIKVSLHSVHSFLHYLTRRACRPWKGGSRQQCLFDRAQVALLRTVTLLVTSYARSSIRLGRFRGSDYSSNGFMIGWLIHNSFRATQMLMRWSRADPGPGGSRTVGTTL